MKAARRARGRKEKIELKSKQRGEIPYQIYRIIGLTKAQPISNQYIYICILSIIFRRCCDLLIFKGYEISVKRGAGGGGEKGV